MNDKFGHEWVRSRWNDPKSHIVWMVCKNCQCLAKFENQNTEYVLAPPILWLAEIDEFTCDEIITLTIMQS
jgi:hypothetical protein